MRASRSREVSVSTALELLKSELSDLGLVAKVTGDGDRAAVMRCQLRDSAGRLVADTSGYGGPNAAASAMFEAWQHFWHKQGFSAMRSAPHRMRIMGVAEIISQPALAADAMVHRLARDYPQSHIACLRYDPLFNADEALWYPAFARFPWCRQYPVHGDGGYAAYQRYATASGTATGTSAAEALLHGLLEVIESDAVSLALLDWFLDGRTAPRRVLPEHLPADLQLLMTEAESVTGCAPAVFDIGTDLGVPAFIAMPSRPGPLGGGGEGASLMPGYAVERALGELVQAHRWLARNPWEDARLRRMAGNLGPWPVLERCARLDPVDLMERAEAAPPRSPEWWDPPALDVAGQLGEVTRRLSVAGYQGYYLRWNAESAAVPVVTSLVPGLETFFLARQGIPVLPTGRGVSRVAH